MSVTRRSLLNAAGWTALSWSRVAGANERLRVASLGTGGRSQYLLRFLKEYAAVDIVALNDIFPGRLLQARTQLAPQAAMMSDWRAVLARDDVDAVVIGSPDHLHVPMTVAAVEAGKDVYVEKPVTHSAAEGSVLIEAVTRSKQIVQAGYQQRSFPHMAEAREIIRAGQLGPVALVETYWNQDYLSAGGPPEIRAEQLDWEQFLGNAPVRQFDPWRYAQWRFYWDYGGGTITDLFSHWIDTVHWLLDDSVPMQASGLCQRQHVKHWECPDTVSAALTYPKGHVVSYTSAMVTQLLDGGMVFRGTEASLHLTRKGYDIYSDASSIAQKTDTPKPDRSATAQREGTIDHLLNWVECIRSRKTPKANVTSAVAAANAAHYTNQALRAAKTISLPPREGAWRNLFDGKSYKGWVPDSAEIWNIRESQLIGRAINLKWNEYLRTEAAFGDFELRLQLRLAGGNGLSGIIFRGIPSAEPHEVSGYNACIGEKIWGSLYDEARRSTYLARPEPEMLLNLDPNGWQEYLIRAEGRHISLTLNGTRTVDYEEPDRGIVPRGFLALQVHSGGPTLTQFREIEIRELY